MTDLTAIPALTETETKAIDEMALAVVAAFGKYGLNCVVMVSGRNYERLAIAEDGQFDAPLILASAYASLAKYNESRKN